jgi:Ca-activated chloride channel family protein
MVVLASLAGARAQEGFTFKSGVDLVNVTATVTDDDGRFVPGLTRDDFTVYDNGQPQTITHFSSDRVPVSLGIALDSSGSMTPEKMAAAREAINRFVLDLLGEDDELFFIEFADTAHLRQDWTTDRGAISRAVGRISPGGGTAMYDAIAEALPVAAAGRHRKKALLVISDGNDSDSAISVQELRQAIRESEVLVYALGVDATAPARRIRTQPPNVPPVRPPFPVPIPTPTPFPGPGTRRPPFALPQILGGRPVPASGSERVNAAALRQVTDDTGGRTEIIRDFGDLDAATARIADELSKQYSLGYPSPAERDGRWHTIRVEVKDPDLTVRARRGYTS